MADGFLARRFNIQSDFDAKLDSIADLIFFSACFAAIIEFLEFKTYIWIWILLIFIFKLSALLISKINQRSFIFRHIKLNKITGFMLFISIPFINFEFIQITVCIAATFASLEELAKNVKYT